MLLVPFRVSDTQYSIFVVLSEENIRRIKTYDPAEVSIPKLPAEWQALRLREVLIGWATPREIADLQACNDTEAVAAQLKKLTRGFAFRPQLGDANGPYASRRG
jgi:hypothetical protein